MAVQDGEPFGMWHVTVIPTNATKRDGDAEEGASETDASAGGFEEGAGEAAARTGEVDGSRGEAAGSSGGSGEPEETDRPSEPTVPRHR